MAFHKVKAPQKKKVPSQVIDFIQLNTMAMSYNLHFANYSLGKKHVTQLILVVVWKQVYTDYQTNHLDSYLAKETFKDQLWDTLKELKIEISNEKGLEKTTLQCDQELKHLKATKWACNKECVKKTSKSY
jgi:hypothetical protein